MVTSELDERTYRTHISKREKITQEENDDKCLAQISYDLRCALPKCDLSCCAQTGDGNQQELIRSSSQNRAKMDFCYYMSHPAKIG